MHHPAAALQQFFSAATFNFQPVQSVCASQHQSYVEKISGGRSCSQYPANFTVITSAQSQPLSSDSNNLFFATSTSNPQVPAAHSFLSSVSMPNNFKLYADRAMAGAGESEEKKNEMQRILFEMFESSRANGLLFSNDWATFPPPIVPPSITKAYPVH